VEKILKSAGLTSATEYRLCTGLFREYSSYKHSFNPTDVTIIAQRI